MFIYCNTEKHFLENRIFTRIKQATELDIDSSYLDIDSKHYKTYAVSQAEE